MFRGVCFFFFFNLLPMDPTPAGAFAVKVSPALLTPLLSAFCPLPWVFSETTLWNRTWLYWTINSLSRKETAGLPFRRDALPASQSSWLIQLYILHSLQSPRYRLDLSHWREALVEMLPVWAKEWKGFLTVLWHTFIHGFWYKLHWWLEREIVLKKEVG